MWKSQPLFQQFITFILGDLIKMKHQLKKEIGTRMRQIRKALGFTQNKIVSYFEIGRANYSRIEKGEIFPGATILSILSAQFNVSLDWVITGVGDMFVEDSNIMDDQDPKFVDISKYPEETQDLLLHMDRVPMIKHAVLGFFIEYKTRNKKFIEPVLETYGNQQV